MAVSYTHLDVYKRQVQQKVVEYFASFDEHIKDFKIEKIPSDGEVKEDTYKINAVSYTHLISNRLFKPDLRRRYYL